jgi:hypothetical protein
VLFAGGYVLFWRQFWLVEFPLGLSGTLYLLGFVALVQFGRLLILDGIRRRVAALGIVLGMLTVILGLNPTGGCSELMTDCTTLIQPNPLLFVGIVILTVSLYVELWGLLGNSLER